MTRNKDGSIPSRLPDLGNLLEATCDILVKYKILADDNCVNIYSHDGSRVYFDIKYGEEEYTEIWIDDFC